MKAGNQIIAVFQGNNKTQTINHLALKVDNFQEIKKNLEKLGYKIYKKEKVAPSGLSFQTNYKARWAMRSICPPNSPRLLAFEPLSKPFYPIFRTKGLYPTVASACPLDDGAVHNVQAPHFFIKFS